MAATEPNAYSRLGVRLPFLKAHSARMDADESIAVYIESVQKFVGIRPWINVAARSDAHQIDNPFGVLRGFAQIVPGNVLFGDVFKKIGRMQFPPDGALHAPDEGVFLDSATEQTEIGIGKVATAVRLHKHGVDASCESTDTLRSSLFHPFELVMVVIHFAITHFEREANIRTGWLILLDYCQNLCPATGLIVGEKKEKGQLAQK